jgi:hypothetical protein
MAPHRLAHERVLRSQQRSTHGAEKSVAAQIHGELSTRKLRNPQQYQVGCWIDGSLEARKAFDWEGSQRIRDKGPGHVSTSGAGATLDQAQALGLVHTAVLKLRSMLPRRTSSTGTLTVFRESTAGRTLERR